MNITNHLKTGRYFLSLALLLLMATASFSQSEYTVKEGVNIVVSGTSTMHDWDMKSSSGTSKAAFAVNSSGHITGLSSLNFSVPATSLQSGKKAMDKNAWKALKTTEHPNIVYVLSNAAVAADGTIKCNGKLTIAGTTLDTDLVATSKINADKSITVTGRKKISMKDFKMIPPSFMMGTIKTGNDVTLQFDVTFKK